MKAGFELNLRHRLRLERGFTRSHALSELFSAFTCGNLAIRLTADAAATLTENLATDLDFVDLTPLEIISELKQARRLSVRGGRVHDLMHALAAEKSGATELLTSDQNDFAQLSTILKVQQV